MKKILYLSSIWPEPDASAAGWRCLQLIEAFQKKGWSVCFVATGGREAYREQLLALGVECIFIETDSDLRAVLTEKQPTAVVFDRFYMEERFSWMVREHCPDALRILDTVDLHGLRESRRVVCETGGSIVAVMEASLDYQSKTVLRELGSIMRSDLTLIISSHELELLETSGLGKGKIHYFPLLGRGKNISRQDAKAQRKKNGKLEKDENGEGRSELISRPEKGSALPRPVIRQVKKHEEHEVYQAEGMVGGEMVFVSEGKEGLTSRSSDEVGTGVGLTLRGGGCEQEDIRQDQQDLQDGGGGKRFTQRRNVGEDGSFASEGHAPHGRKRGGSKILEKETRPSDFDLRPSFTSRKGYCMIGNFRHAPNADSFEWMMMKLWPLIREKDLAAELFVYGAYPAKKHMQWDNPDAGIHMQGPSKDVLKDLAKHRVLLAPLRFGAGMKGKIMDAWAAGTAVVTTPIGAEGMGQPFEASMDAFSNEDSFSRAAVLLHNDEASWHAAQKQGSSALAVFDPKNHQEYLLNAIEEHQAVLDDRRSQDLLQATLWQEQFRGTEFFGRWTQLKEWRINHEAAKFITPEEWDTK